MNTIFTLSYFASNIHFLMKHRIDKNLKIKEVSKYDCIYKQNFNIAAAVTLPLRTQR